MTSASTSQLRRKKVMPLKKNYPKKTASQNIKKGKMSAAYWSDQVKR